MKSSYIDNHKFQIWGGGVVLALRDSETEAKAYAAASSIRLGKPCTIQKPGQKPVVGRYRHGKGGKVVGQ